MPKIGIHTPWGGTKLGIGTLVMVHLGSSTSGNQNIMFDSIKIDKGPPYIDGLRIKLEGPKLAYILPGVVQS